MQKYGLQIRVKPSQQSKKPPRPPPPTLLSFGDNDDDDVEKEISRQASKNKSLKDIEEHHKKALEEDPSVFDYDGVYDDMKQKMALPRAQDREERKPKYIQALIKKAEQRQREQEIVYERKLARERTKDDHLYADKDKFITAAYKRKLAEQAKWLEEERLQELREQKDDVTKKTDLSDFYFNLGRNVAFGAKDIELSKSQQGNHPNKSHEQDEDHADRPETSKSERPHSSNDMKSALESSVVDSKQIAANPLTSESSEGPEPAAPNEPVANSASQEGSAEQASGDQPKRDHHKRNEDAVAAAKERFLARKKAKLQ